MTVYQLVLKDIDKTIVIEPVSSVQLIIVLVVKQMWINAINVIQLKFY